MENDAGLQQHATRPVHELVGALVDHAHLARAESQHQHPLMTPSYALFNWRRAEAMQNK